MGYSRIIERAILRAINDPTLIVKGTVTMPTANHSAIRVAPLTTAPARRPDLHGATAARPARPPY